MKNNINILNALNESLEEEFKAKRKLNERYSYSTFKTYVQDLQDLSPKEAYIKVFKETKNKELALDVKLEIENIQNNELNEAEDNNSNYKIKTYHIEDMGGHTMALFGQFENGNYFAGNEDGINIYDEDVWPYYENDEDIDWIKYNNSHLIGDINPDIDTFNNIMRYTNFMNVEDEESINEASFKDKVSAIKKSLKKNDKRLSNKSAQKSAEKIAGSMIKNEADDNEFYNYVKNLLDVGAIDDPDYYNSLSDEEKEDLIKNTWMKDKEIINDYNNINEAQEFVITYIPDNNQKDKTASILIQGNNKQQAAQQARQTIGNAAIVSIQPLQENKQNNLKESKITDYISQEELENLVKSNDLFGFVENVEVLDDMIIRVKNKSGYSFYKIIKNNNGQYEAYWIDKSGKALGDSFILKEDEVITIPNTEVETDYIINDVTVLDNISDGDVQAPDIEALLTLIDESLKSKYTNEWGRIKTLSSSKNEAYSYALVDISTPEILKEFEEKGISDVAIGKNLILESIAGMYKFKVNNLNGTTKYSKVTTNPKQAIYEWIESEFLQEAKEEKAKELEILKAKTEKETIENYIANRIDLKQEIENIKMFIDLSKQVKAQNEMKSSIQDRMYAFAVEIPQSIEIKNNDDKYELSFSNLDQVVEIIFGKEWVKEKEEIPEVLDLTEEVKLNDKVEIINSNKEHNGKKGEVTYIDSDIITVKLNNGRSFNYDKNQVKKLNEAYEQFNIGNIEVVFNPDTFECLYSISSADVKDKKINLTKIPTVDTPYDTNTIIKDYIETRFGRIPSEEQNKNQQQVNKEQPTEEVPVEEPVNQQTTGEEISVSSEDIQEDELPEEPGNEVDTDIDINDIPEEPIDQETEESQAETGSATFLKIRPNQHSNIENVREKNLDGDTPQSNYIVVDTIDLSPEQFDDFISDLSKPQSFLTGIQSLDRKNYSFNVVKITSSAADYTLLVDPLGYDYARYISIEDKIQ